VRLCPGAEKGGQGGSRSPPGSGAASGGGAEAGRKGGGRGGGSRGRGLLESVAAGKLQESLGRSLKPILAVIIHRGAALI
jgi:hypothetical protein